MAGALMETRVAHVFGAVASLMSTLPAPGMGFSVATATALEWKCSSLGCVLFIQKDCQLSI